MFSFRVFCFNDAQATKWPSVYSSGAGCCGTSGQTGDPIPLDCP